MAISLIFITLIILNIIIQQNGFRKLIIKKIERDYQEKLIQSAIEAQEKERSRFARDLHDDIGSLLCAAKIHLSNIKKEGSSKKNLISTIENANEIVVEAIEHVRDITKNLMPSSIKKFGVAPALMNMCEHISKGRNHNATFNESGVPFRFDPDKELGIYRIVQEVLNNALKHSNAKLIQVFLNWSKSDLEVEITDNGKGFNYLDLINNTTCNQGFGLSNLQTRAIAIGAFINYDSEKGKGTKIQIGLNFNNKIVEKKRTEFDLRKVAAL